MIPRIIYTCWLSDLSTMPDGIKRCVDSQLKYHPDYEHVIIDYSKYKDIEDELPSWVKRSFRQNDYAHVSDYLRIYYVYKYGGIYLDSDVELIKNENIFDKYLGYDFFSNVENAYKWYIEPFNNWDKYFNHKVEAIDLLNPYYREIVNYRASTDGTFKLLLGMKSFFNLYQFKYGIGINGAMFGALKSCEFLGNLLKIYNSDRFKNYIHNYDYIREMKFYPNICNIMSKAMELYGFSYKYEYGKEYLFNNGKYILFTDRFENVDDVKKLNDLSKIELLHHTFGSWR